MSHKNVSSPANHGRSHEPLERQRLAGCVLMNHQREVFLLHRATDPAQWELPGGKIESGESPAVAARRELWEELGIRIALADRLGEATFRQNGSVWSYVWYVSKSWTGTPAIREPHTFDKLERFSVAELRNAREGFSPSVCVLAKLLRRNELAL